MKYNAWDYGRKNPSELIEEYMDQFVRSGLVTNDLETKEEKRKTRARILAKDIIKVLKGDFSQKKKEVRDYGWLYGVGANFPGYSKADARELLGRRITPYNDFGER